MDVLNGALAEMLAVPKGPKDSYTSYTYWLLGILYGTNQNKVPVPYSWNSGSTLRSVIMEGTLEPCHLYQHV